MYEILDWIYLWVLFVVFSVVAVSVFFFFFPVSNSGIVLSSVVASVVFLLSLGLFAAYTAEPAKPSRRR